VKIIGNKHWGIRRAASGGLLIFGGDVRIRSKRALASVGALAAVCTGFVAVEGLQTAEAAGTPDLVLTQTPANGSASGHTKVVVTVKNVGTAAAVNTVITTQVYVSGGLSFVPQNATLQTACPPQAAPPGVAAQFTCIVKANIEAGATYTLNADYSGTVGKAFKVVSSVGNTAGELDYANNLSTLQTHIGPRADLKLAQATVLTTLPGTRKFRTTVTNAGPWTATSLQLILEVKSPSMTSLSAGSLSQSTTCQQIPPATGYTFGFSCTTSSLAPTKSWLITFTGQGTAGGSLVVDSSVSSFVVDPNLANNKASTTTTFLVGRG